MSIPIESIDGDITADHDQEHLCPPLTNLDPSEEQTMSSPTSSCASFDLVALNGNANNDKESMADQEEEEEQTKPDQLEHLQENFKQIELKLKDINQLEETLSAKVEAYQKQQQTSRH
uniref:Uncharacterized protein n=1 Tax=Globodera rostochiensis TaxID=31243 RepID=A0A914HSI8_GLORO